MSVINVLKFGGSSVSNNENLKIVADKIIKIKKSGVNVVVVVSAQGKRTDELIKQVEELNKISRENQRINEKDNFFIDRTTVSYNKREIDSLLTIGEQESASKLSILLNEMGYKSIALNALQAGIFTNSDFGKAKIIDIDTTRILKELENNKIVIVTGFQGIDKEKNFTTLGRGGSDTSAVALAIKLNAEKCYIFSDVDGVYNADPNIIKNAKKLKHISYSEMENASSEGAKVLCERSISLADKYNMKIIAKSTFNGNEGWVLKSDTLYACDECEGRKAIDMAEKLLYNPGTHMCTFDHYNAKTVPEFSEKFVSLAAHSSCNYGYDLNCANFVTAILRANGLMNSSAYTFVDDVYAHCTSGKDGYRVIDKSQAKPGDFWVTNTMSHAELVVGYYNGALLLIGSNNFDKSTSLTNMCQETALTNGKYSSAANDYQRVSYGGEYIWGYVCSRQ